MGLPRNLQTIRNRSAASSPYAAPKKPQAYVPPYRRVGNIGKPATPLLSSVRSVHNRAQKRTATGAGRSYTNAGQSAAVDASQYDDGASVQNQYHNAQTTQQHIPNTKPFKKSMQASSFSHMRASAALAKLLPGFRSGGAHSSGNPFEVLPTSSAESSFVGQKSLVAVHANDDENGYDDAQEYTEQPVLDHADMPSVNQMVNFVHVERQALIGSPQRRRVNKPVKTKRYFQEEEEDFENDFDENEFDENDADDMATMLVDADLLRECQRHNRIINWHFPSDTPIPKSIRKYWNNRYTLFHRYDSGIMMDYDGWFSVTPERIASHIATRVCGGSRVVLDGFAGIGGNAIQFALQGSLVVAVDFDLVRLMCAKHNARVYGVENQIVFVHGDFFDVVDLFKTDTNDADRIIRRNMWKQTSDVDNNIPHELEDDDNEMDWSAMPTGTILSAKTDADAIRSIPKPTSVFLSPPWGGPAYLQQSEYNLDTMLPNMSGSHLLHVARMVSPNVVYFLPRNLGEKHVNRMAVMAGGKCEVETTFLNDKKKNLTVYFGKFVNDQSWKSNEAEESV